MTDLILDTAKKAADELLEQLKSDIGANYEDESVRRVMTISLGLVEQVGDEGFGMIERLLDGGGEDAEVLSDHLSLLEMSDLLDIAQSLEAKDREAISRMGAAIKSAGMQIASTVLKAAILAI